MVCLLGFPFTPRSKALETAEGHMVAPGGGSLLPSVGPTIMHKWGLGEEQRDPSQMPPATFSLVWTLAGVHCPTNSLSSSSPALPSSLQQLQASVCSQEQSHFLGKVKCTNKNSPLHQPPGPGQSCCGWCSPGGAEEGSGGGCPGCWSDPGPSTLASFQSGLCLWKASRSHS